MSHTCNSHKTETTRHTTLSKKQHIAIIGSGSAAFAAAIKATELGAKVTIIEAADNIGGTCVNVGCVPSKIFIRGAHIADLQNNHNFKGIALNKPSINRKEMVKQQQQWVEKLRITKYENILNTNPDISLIKGFASFKDSFTLSVSRNDGSSIDVKADKFLLATGASADLPDLPGLTGTPFWTSTEALVAEEIPEHLLVIGASVVALEMAQAFHQLGSKVTILARHSLLSREDPAISEALTDIFNQQGMNVIPNTHVELVEYNNNSFILRTTNGEYTGDKLLVATGRKANTSALSLENVGVKTDKSGRIIIDEYMRTNVEHIYAAGDCTTHPQFVYVAAAAGTHAARNMLDKPTALDLSIVPSVIFTNPQVATVGLSESNQNSFKSQIKSRTLTLENVPRAIANMNTHGFIKLVADKNTGRILGCQVIANEAGEIIQTAALAIQNKMTVQELADQLFPYLTMVEGLKLTAQTFFKDVKQLSCCAG